MASATIAVAPSPAAQQLPLTVQNTLPLPQPQSAAKKDVVAFVSEQDELERLRLAVTACTEYLLHERQRRQGHPAVSGKTARHINHLPARASPAVTADTAGSSGSSAPGGASSARSSPSPAAEVAQEPSSRSSSATYNSTPPTSIGSDGNGYFDEKSTCSNSKASKVGEGILATEPHAELCASPSLTSRIIESHVPGLIAASAPSLRRRWLGLYTDHAGVNATASNRKESLEHSLGPLEVGWFSRRIYDLFCDHAQTHQRLSFGLSSSSQPWFHLKQGFPSSGSGSGFEDDDDDEPIDDEDIQGLVLYWGEIDSVHDHLRRLVHEQIVESLAPPALRAPGWTRSQLLYTAGSTPRDILDHRGHIVSKSPDEQYVNSDGSCLLSITEIAWHNESVRQLLDLTRMWRFETHALGVKVLRTEVGEVNIVVTAAEADASRPIRVWTHGEQALAQVRSAKERIEASAQDEPDKAPIEVRILDGSIARLDRAWFTSEPQTGASTPRSVTLDLALLAQSISDSLLASSSGTGARPQHARGSSPNNKRSSEVCGWADRNGAAREDLTSAQEAQEAGDAPPRRRKREEGCYGLVQAGNAPSSSASSDDADLSEDDDTADVGATEAASRGCSASRSPAVPWTSRHARRLEEVRQQLQELEAKVEG